MSANPSRRERWPIPRTTRHVWILGDYRHVIPLQGYVVDWRRHNYKWSALVVYIDERDPDRPVTQRWIRAEKLVPVRSVPDDLLSDPFRAWLWRDSP